VFYCILQVLEENPSNSNIRMKSANSLLKRFNYKSILNLIKKEFGKISYSWKKFRMNMSRYFNHNFLIKYHIAMKLTDLER
jgi:hypothetical protein